MASQMQLGLLLFFSMISSIFCITTSITGPSIFTNWGPWATNMDICPDHTFVQAFQLKTHRPDHTLTSVDRTGLNGIRLFCGNHSSPSTVQLTSHVGHLGDWGSVHVGHGVLNGFQLRAEEPRDGNDPDADDLAVTNIIAFFTGSGGSIVGDGLDQGDWREERHCNKGQGVCGLQTQVQPNQGDGDDATLLNIRMLCCDVHGTGYTIGHY